VLNIFADRLLLEKIKTSFSLALHTKIVLFVIFKHLWSANFMEEKE